MNELFLTFTPRLIFNLGLVHFRVQKRSNSREYLESFQSELEIHGIECSITKSRNGKYTNFLLQIHGDNVFLFLDFVNDFKGGEEWKQICARKIRQMAEMRKLFT